MTNDDVITAIPPPIVPTSANRVPIPAPALSPTGLAQVQQPNGHFFLKKNIYVMTSSLQPYGSYLRCSSFSFCWRRHPSHHSDPLRNPHRFRSRLAQIQILTAIKPLRLPAAREVIPPRHGKPTTITLLPKVTSDDVVLRNDDVITEWDIASLSEPPATDDYQADYSSYADDSSSTSSAQPSYKPPRGNPTSPQGMMAAAIMGMGKGAPQLKKAGVREKNSGKFPPSFILGFNSHFFLS